MRCDSTYDSGRMLPFAGMLLLAVAVMPLASCGWVDGLRGLGGMGDSPCPECGRDAGADGAVPDAGGLSDSTADASQEDLPPVQSLAVTAVEPSVGDSGGGEIVMVRGEGFEEGMKLYFGGVPGAKLFVVTPQLMTIETPGHSPGLVDVRALLPDGTEATLKDAFRYESQLTIESVVPAQADGAGGQPIEVRGSGFQGDCQLYLGERRALEVVVKSDGRMLAVTPPGGCGPATVRVQCGEEWAKAEDLFRFIRFASLNSIDPPVADAGGYEMLMLHGAGFQPGMTVYFGDLAITQVTVLSHELAWLSSPVSAPGIVDVRIETGCGVSYIPDAFVFRSSGGDGAPAEFTGMSPTRLAACSGGIVTIALSQPVAETELEVWMDDLPLDVLDVEEVAGLIRAVVPPRDPGEYEMKVLLAGKTLVGPKPLRMEARMSIEAVVPDRGLPEGGEWVEVVGCGLPSSGEVWFGPLPALEFESLGPNRIRALTPPGSPGPVDVYVAGPYGSGAKPAAFEYTSPYPRLAFVTPDEGARCGGTFVRFVGSGLSQDATYTLGGLELMQVFPVHSGLVVGRMPALPVGTHTAQAQIYSTIFELPEAFTSYDPGNKNGGTWGPPIRETLNVTVYDSGTGKGLAAAFVVVRNDPDTPHQGYTDENGQITFSLPGFAGRQDITAAKVGYSLYSVVDFDATNVSVYLSPSAPSEPSGGSTTQVQSFVTGRVRGLDKYVPLPPGNCMNKPITGVLCRPCFDDAGCFDPYAPPPGPDTPPAGRCTQIGETGQFCTVPCLAPTDCPTGFVCMQTFPDMATCVPSPGQRTAKCFVSKTSLFGGGVSPGTGSVVNEHDIYFVASRTGEVAIYCLGGYTDWDTKQFEPMSLGLKRNVIVLKNQVVENQDVDLTIPLNHEAKVAFYDLPYHPSGTGQPYLMTALEIGKDGFLPPPKEPTYVADGRYYQFKRLPNPAAPELNGTTYSMYTSVNAGGYTGVPYAVRMVEKVERLGGEGIVTWNSGSTTLESPPIKGDPVGLFLTADGYSLATSGGQFLQQLENGWSATSTPGAYEGFSASHKSSDGTLWLGGKRGSVWRFDGTAWQRDTVGMNQPVKDLWAGGGAWVALYSTMLAKRNVEGQLVTQNLPIGEQGKAVWASDADDVYVLTQSYYTQNSYLYNWSKSGWMQLVLPGVARAFAIDGTGPDDIWIAGSAGTVVHFDGDTWTPTGLATLKDLLSIRATPGGNVIVGAEDGQLYRRVGDGFERIETGIQMDVTVLDFDDGTERGIAAGPQAYPMGPFMGYPRMDNPFSGAMFDWERLDWSFFDPTVTSDTNYFIFSNAEGRAFWIITTGGGVTEFLMPPLREMLGVNLIPDGMKRLNLTSTLNPEFNIDHYTNQDMNMYGKVSWAVDYITFF